jgi:hypothetical protein
LAFDDDVEEQAKGRYDQRLQQHCNRSPNEE